MNPEQPFNLEPELREELDKIPKEASDAELALFFAKHIDNPCEVEVEPGKKEDIRQFYLKEAKDIIPKMTNNHARRFLELKIKEY